MSVNGDCVVALRITWHKSYLFKSPLGGTDLVHHPQWDADHGRERQQPANDIAPPWVHILVVVFQWGVLDEREGEGTLKGTTRVTWVLCALGPWLDPSSFFVWLPQMLLRQFVDTHNARGRGEEQPTVLDVRAWAVANHVFNVVIEAVDTWVNTEN